MYKGHVVSVVVPAYNEESLIFETLLSVPDYIDHIYVVDDGSKDSTWDKILGCNGRDGRIIPLRHDRNLGVGAAIITGYKRSLKDGIEIAVVVAGDNQMDTARIPDLLEPILAGRAEYAKGNRLMSSKYRQGMSKWRFLGNAILTLLTKLASGYWQIMDPQNGFTAISRRALETLDLDRVYASYGYCNDLLVKLNVYGFRVVDVQIPARYGNEKSKIRYVSYIMRVSLMLLLNFFWRLKMKYVVMSFNPVVFFYMAGLLITHLSIIFGAYSIHYFIQGGSLFIRAALSLLLFIVGMQFLLFAMLFDMQNDRQDQ